MFSVEPITKLKVHGDIRHLENYEVIRLVIIRVHGDIRHLEKIQCV